MRAPCAWRWNSDIFLIFSYNAEQTTSAFINSFINRILIIILKYMLDQSLYYIQQPLMFYPSYVIYTLPLQLEPILQPIIQKIEKMALKNHKKIKAKKQTQRLKSTSKSCGVEQTDKESDYRLEKRPYSKRRPNLVKGYGCSKEGCPSRYSSEMALRNHERLKHNLMRRMAKRKK